MMLKETLTGFADEISPDLNVQMDVLDSLDIHYIEMRGVDGRNLCDYSLEEARTVKTRLCERGFALSAVGSPIGKIKISDPFEPHFEKFCHACDLAELFETPRIRIFSFYIPPEEDPASYRDEVLRRMSAMVDEAKRRGLVLLHENEKYIYGDTPERCLDLMQEFYGEHFQATFDPANFVQCQVNVYPHAYDLLAPYIAYMHIKDAHLTDGTVTVAGRGDGGVKEVLSRLSEKNFEGFLSLEPHLTDFVGFKDLEQHAVEEVKEDAGMGAKLFAAAAGALRGLLEEIRKEGH